MIYKEGRILEKSVYKTSCITYTETKWTCPNIGLCSPPVMISMDMATGQICVGLSVPQIERPSSGKHQRVEPHRALRTASIEPAHQLLEFILTLEERKNYKKL